MYLHLIRLSPCGYFLGALEILKFKGGPIPVFSNTFDTLYRAKNFTDTDSNTDSNIYIIYIHTYICGCLRENPPSLHLPVFREIPF